MKLERNNFDTVENQPIPDQKKEASPLPVVEEFVPKSLHHQEDLRYMFGIKAENENELYGEEIKEKMYEEAVKELKNGSAFALDYFINEGLLSRNNIKQEDIPMLREHALRILSTTKNITRRTSFQNLFLDTGILTEEYIEHS